MSARLGWDHPVASGMRVTLSKVDTNRATNTWDVRVPTGGSKVEFTHRVPDAVMAALDVDGGPVIESWATISAARLNAAVVAAGYA